MVDAPPSVQMERRVAEALKLGFSRVVIPAGSDVRRSGRLVSGALVECSTVGEALKAVLGHTPGKRRRGRMEEGEEEEGQ